MTELPLEHPQGAEALASVAKTYPVVATFLRLVREDTQSDESSTTAPSTPSQRTLLQTLQTEIAAKAAALQVALKIWQTDQGVLCVHLPASAGCEEAPHLALLAHIDTAPDCSGRGVKPQLICNYQGGTIALSSGLRLTTQLCPQLNAHRGDDIIVTDGTTLLGADDKAGCAVMLTLIDRAFAGDLIHGPLSFIFTVDEEIGRSADYVPLAELGADFGVTIDGCAQGELDVATFNAAACTVTFKGRAIHTGSACGKLINAAKLASSFVLQLPENEAPETTAGQDGFYHVYKLTGGVEQAQVHLLLRDFSTDGLKARKTFVENLAAKINRIYPRSVRVEIRDQYVNLAAYLQTRPQILELCRAAYAKAGVTPVEHWVRGGTDGSNLSARGLPCPNIFTGALNCHGPYECLPVGALLASLNCSQALIELTAAAELA